MKFPAKSVPASIVGYVALILMLTAGAAESLAGSNTVFGDDIVDGTITTPDLKTGALSGSKILDNSVTSADIANGTIVAVDIGAYVGPRASGHVDSAGNESLVHGAVVNASQLTIGQYCVEVDGALPTNSVMVATLNDPNSPTAHQSRLSGTVEVRQDIACGDADTGFSVRTFLHDDGVNPEVISFDAGFNFVVN